MKQPTPAQQCPGLIENMRKYVVLGEEECALISSRVRIVTIQRKGLMLRMGQVARDAAFVLSGCLRSYSIDHNGFEHILQFAPAGWWITDMYSFISKKDSYLEVEAIRESEVALLSRDDQLALFDEVPALERYFRVLTENALVSTRQRLMENLSIAAGERYRQFCQTYPALINEIPQKLIAAYIGVTPEFLSKIRSMELNASKKEKKQSKT